MSVNSAMTAIADKIRTLLGISGTMGLDNMSTNLQTAVTTVDTQTDLIAQIEAALEGKTALPALSNAGTASDLASGKQLIDQNGNIITGTHQCQAGVTVQRKSGTFTTSTSGTATVNCGFKPDEVFLTGTNPMNGNLQCHTGVAFTDGNVNSMETIFASPSASYLISSFTITQSASGFSVDSRKVNISMEVSYDSNRTVNYIAVKYS